MPASRCSCHSPEKLPDGSVHQAPEIVHLFFHSPGPVSEGLSEHFEFHGVPPDADAQAQPAAGQEIDFRRLLGDQRRLALRQDQDGGGKLDPLRRAGQETEQGEGLVEHVVERVIGPPVLGIVGDLLHHMVDAGEVVVAEGLHLLREPADSSRVRPDFRRRKCHADLHAPLRLLSKGLSVPA